MHKTRPIMWEKKRIDVLPLEIIESYESVCKVFSIVRIKNKYFETPLWKLYEYENEIGIFTTSKNAKGYINNKMWELND